MINVNGIEVSGSHEFVSLFLEVANEYESNKRKWCEKLIKDGFSAAHPNDGWVNRKHNYFQLVYPHFSKPLGVGDKVMLGWHSDESSWRPVVVTSISLSLVGGMARYHFEDIP